jgi:cytochrome oxidase assembly protein ShyY1
MPPVVESPGDAVTVRSGMYRFLFTPKWIGFHLLVVAGIVGMINLGLWQLHRLDTRQDFNAVVEARYDAPPVPLHELLTPDADPDAVAWRPVSIRGTYLPDEQILIANRSQNGRAGDNVVTPLDLGDGRVLLANRGFVPLAIDPPSAPPGIVEIIARLRPSEERRRGQLSDPADGDLQIAQRVDIDRLAPQLPGAVLPMYVDVLSSDPPEADPGPEPVIAPDLSEGNHLSYAVQWFVFAAAAAVGWTLAVRRSVGTRRRSAPDQGAEAPIESRQPAPH